MAYNTQVSDAAANAACNALCALANSGSVKIYTGTQPATANTAATGTLLVSLPLGATAFATAVAGVATCNAVTTTAAAATGVAGYFRVFKSDGTTALFDGSIGTSGCNMNLNSTTLTAAVSVQVSGFTFAIMEAVSGS